mgnify:FL=1
MSVFGKILKKWFGTTTARTLTASDIEAPKHHCLPPMERIIRATCTVTGVTRNELLSGRRPAEFVHARHIAMYLAREYTTLSLPQIGRAMNKDHTTVHYVANKMAKRGRGATKVNRDLAAVKKAAGLDG